MATLLKITCAAWSFVPNRQFLPKVRGHLTKTLFENLICVKVKPQTFAIGIKELWDINPEKAQPGLAGIQLAGHCQPMFMAAIPISFNW